jgi:hypothetical protein
MIDPTSRIQLTKNATWFQPLHSKKYRMISWLFKREKQSADAILARCKPDKSGVHIISRLFQAFVSKWVNLYVRYHQVELQRMVAAEAQNPSRWGGCTS